MLYDTVTYAGTEKSLAAWGFALDSVEDVLRNQEDDIFQAMLAQADPVAETNSPTFGFEQTITVQINRTSSTGATNSFSGGTISFTGKRVGNPSQVSGSKRGVTYRFYGPWYDLSNTHYLQTFKGQSGTPYLAAETILNTSTALTTGQIQISVGDQIQAILQWLLDSSGEATPPFQYIGRALNGSNKINLDVGSTPGTPGGDYSFTGLEYNLHIQSGTTIHRSLFSLFLPSYITKPIMCAEALRKCLAFSPRVVCWFDYTQSPPMIYFSDIDDATTSLPQNLFLFDGTNHKSLGIQARNDLLVKAVRILYRINSTVGGSAVVDYAVDKWGPNGSNSALDPDYGLRVVDELVDLQGDNQAFAKGHLDVEPIAAVGGTQAAKVAWWSAQRGGDTLELADSRVRFQDKNGTITSIPDATYIDSATGATLTSANLVADGFCDASSNPVFNRLCRGTHHSWMKRADGQPIVSKMVKVQATMTYAEYDCQAMAGDGDRSGNRQAQHNDIDHSKTLELTNGVTGTYQTVATTTPGENYIIGTGGIAQYLYSQMNILQFEGDFAKVETTFGTGISLGGPINFNNGATLWMTMKAQAQEIRHHYGRHETSVRIGVAKHLNGGQLKDLLNMWIHRRTWYNPAIRSDNTVPSGGLIDQPVTAGHANTSNGLQNNSSLTVVDFSTPPTGTTPGVVNGQVSINATALATLPTLNA